MQIKVDAINLSQPVFIKFDYTAKATRTRLGCLYGWVRSSPEHCVTTSHIVYDKLWSDSSAINITDSSERLSWQQAEQECRNKYGAASHLASIRSQQAQKAVDNLLMLR